MKKLAYIVLWAAGVMVLAACNSNSSDGNQDQRFQQGDATSNVFNFKDNGYSGTYQFTDEKGVNCTIVLKDDGTMTAQSSKSDSAKTGTWAVYNNDCPQLKFDDSNDPLFFTFPEGKEQKIKQTINDGVIAEDGYIYAMSIYYDAKKEDKRLPIKRLD